MDFNEYIKLYLNLSKLDLINFLVKIKIHLYYKFSITFSFNKAQSMISKLENEKKLLIKNSNQVMFYRFFKFSFKQF